MALALTRRSLAAVPKSEGWKEHGSGLTVWQLDSFVQSSELRLFLSRKLREENCREAHGVSENLHKTKRS